MEQLPEPSTDPTPPTQQGQPRSTAEELQCFVLKVQGSEWTMSKRQIGAFHEMLRQQCPSGFRTLPHPFPESREAASTEESIATYVSALQEQPEAHARLMDWLNSGGNVFDGSSVSTPGYCYFVVCSNLTMLRLRSPHIATPVDSPHGR